MPWMPALVPTQSDVLYIFSACCNKSMKRRGCVATANRSVATSRYHHHASIIPQCTWAAYTGPTMQSDLQNVMDIPNIFLQEIGTSGIKSLREHPVLPNKCGIVIFYRIINICFPTVTLFAMFCAKTSTICTFFPWKNLVRKFDISQVCNAHVLLLAADRGLPMHGRPTLPRLMITLLVEIVFVTFWSCLELRG